MSSCLMLRCSQRVSRLKDALLWKHRLPLRPLSLCLSSIAASPVPASPLPREQSKISLSMPGGNLFARQRAAQQERIALRLKGMRLPQHGVVHPGDVMWVGGEICFVGVGLRTNWVGLRAAMDAGVFGSRRVAAVRDVFDRDPRRGALDQVSRLVCDDVVAVLRDIVDYPRRRLVNEYVAMEGGGFMLMRNDVDYLEYLHVNGFRVVVEKEDEWKNLSLANLKVQQSTNHVLMVAPTAFESNPMTRVDNQFMEENGVSPKNGLQQNILQAISAANPDAVPVDFEKETLPEIQHKVLKEYAALHREITDKSRGVGAVVHLFTHERFHQTPDALFPNNFFSTHAGTEIQPIPTTLVLYPMRAPNRRLERRPEFLHRIAAFQRYARVVDFTPHEDQPHPRFLEGTGSLVLDRVHKLAFVALSTRSDESLAYDWAREMGYDVFCFEAVDEAGAPIYHTNVMMAIGTHSAVVCGESIRDVGQREKVRELLGAGGRDVVDISLEQVRRFCGNILELENWCGEQVWVMSSQAHGAFTEEQRAILEEGCGNKLVHADISTIERIAGGGVRCSIAELF